MNSHSSFSIKDCLYVVCFSFFLQSCSKREDSPAEIILNKETNPFHTVVKGDTIASVAQKYGMSENELIRFNRLKSPYKIFNGQKLIITPFGKKKKQPQPKQPVIKPVTSVADTGDVDVKSLEDDNNNTAGIGGTAPFSKPSTGVGTPEIGITPSVAPALGLPSSEMTQHNDAEAPASKTMTPPQSTGTLMWPVKGKVIKPFNSNAKSRQKNDGINIAAPAGTPVVAADSGVVAHVGNKIPVFGNVVLIKHTSGKISVYGHLQEAVVKPGQQIQAGQQIGKVGTTGGVAQPQLHFEFRQGKKSLDPQAFLPH